MKLIKDSQVPHKIVQWIWKVIGGILLTLCQVIKILKYKFETARVYKNMCKHSFTKLWYCDLWNLYQQFATYIHMGEDKLIMFANAYIHQNTCPSLGSVGGLLLNLNWATADCC